MSVYVAPETINEAFLAAQPLIAQTIKDFTIKTPNWMASLWESEAWPLGQGSIMQEIDFRGEMPQEERGFDAWKKVGNTSGCAPCESPDCSYNTTVFGGHALERKITELMYRDFRTNSYCVKEIQSTKDFTEVFAKIVENIYRQTDFFKANNIGKNYLTGLAKKFVVDSEGAKINTANVYTYPNTGGVRLSALNIEMLEFFYENLRRMPGTIPFDVVDGSPTYALQASHQLLGRLYRDDANLRQDVRFSGFANDLVTKYNFMSTIRGMFIAAPVLTPRRFNISAAFEPVEVLPYINGVPAEVGKFTGLNPAYEAATHEEVIIHGRSPFKIWYQDTATTLGGGTSFGPTFSFMENWMWVNPQTDLDPARRTGYFYTEATIALAAQYSEGIFGILVERPSKALMAMYTPNPVCPVTPPTCDNIIPETGCPCPVVMSIQADPFVANTYTFVFGTAPGGVAEDAIVLKYDSGVTVTGEIVQVSADGLTVQIVFTTDLPEGACSNIVSVNCIPTLYCSARVVSASDCNAGVDNQISVVLDRPIVADTVDDAVTAYMADCTQVTLTVVSHSGLTWIFDFAAGTPNIGGLLCSTGGIVKICVPTSTDANCPACEPSLTPCVPPEVIG